MVENTENLRAIILYRISTDRQDETLQINVCQKFCMDSKMIIVEEYREIDVSGFKTPLTQRVELLKILARADTKKDFDVLVVYLHDRLGRREDETPTIVPSLAKSGVRCFDATNRNEIKVDSHIDKLMNYMNSWTSEFESIKTSSRVKDGMATKNLTTNYTGGIPPYGYKLIYTDVVNSKGKIVTKLVASEYESEVVKKIFDLATNYNYGAIKISEYLNSNGYTNRPKSVLDKVNKIKTYKSVFFRSNSINRILHNSVYIGKKIYNKTNSERDKIINNAKSDWKQQPYNDELRLIDDATYEIANELISKRKRAKGDHVKTITNSGVLCSGLAYCVCGSKLKSDYSIKKYTKKNNDITISKTYRYICMDGSQNRKSHKDKYGTSIYYSAKKYDNFVEEMVIDEIEKINEEDGIQHILKNLDKDIKRVENQISSKKIDIMNFEKTITKFESLIDDSILNDKGSLDIYTNGIKRNIDKISLTNEEIILLECELENLYQKKETRKNDYKNIINFKARFKTSNFDKKKSMLSDVVKQVVFYNDTIDIIMDF